MLKVNGEVFHIGTTLNTDSVYLGDDITLRGCIFWDERDQKISSHVVDDIYRPEVVVDATQECIDKATAWALARARSLVENLIPSLQNERDELVRVGDTVQVVSGRKVPMGTIGKVFWIGETRYGQSYGVRTSDLKGPDGRWKDTFFTQRQNLAPWQTPALQFPEDELEKIIERRRMPCVPDPRSIERELRRISDML